MRLYTGFKEEEMTHRCFTELVKNVEAWAEEKAEKEWNEMFGKQSLFGGVEFMKEIEE